MATAGMGRQSRLCVILVKVGTPVAKKVFEKRVKDLTPTNHNPSPWTVDEFLLANKPKIKLLKLHSHMWSKIFPVQSHKVKLQQWDLALLCTILTECCDLRPDIRLDICQLRKSRNKFFHMSEPSIDDHKYQHYLTKLKVIFDRCLKEINDDAFTTEMNKMFEDLEQGQFSQVDAEEVMKKLQSMQEETNERLYELGQNQQSMNEKLDYLVQQFKAQESISKLKVPESGAKIEVRNCNLEEDDKLSKVMVQCFKECIDENGGFSESAQNLYDEIKEAVYKMYSKLLSKGYEIVGAHKRCVFLHIQCSSLTSFMSYFQDYVSGQLSLDLQEIEDAIRTLDGCEDIALEIVINTEELLETIVTTVSEFMKAEGILTKTAEEDIYKGKYTEKKSGNLQRDSVSMSSPLEVEYIQQNRESIVDRRIDCAEQSIQDDAAGFKTSLASTNFIGKYALFLGISIVITASCIMCFTTDIRVWVHPDTATENQETQEVLYMANHKELSRTQRKVANDLEQMHLQCGEHPESAKEVQLAVLSAQTQHTKVLDLMEKFTMAAAKFLNMMKPLIDACAKFQSVAVIKEIFSHIIKITEEMKTETKTTQLRYKEIQHKEQKQCAKRNEESAREKKEVEKELAKEDKKNRKKKEELTSEISIRRTPSFSYSLQFFVENQLLNCECPREAHAQLGKVDNHLTRNFEFWSSITAAFKVLRDKATSGSVFVSQIVYPKLSQEDNLFDEGFSKDYVPKRNEESYRFHIEFIRTIVLIGLASDCYYGPKQKGWEDLYIFGINMEQLKKAFVW